MAQSSTSKTRRNFLSAAIGGLTGLLAGRALDTSPAEATHGDVHLGGGIADNTTTTTTSIHNSDFNASAHLAGLSGGTSGNNTGVAGRGLIWGVFGDGDSVGVIGFGPTGVEGQGDNVGVLGSCPSADLLGGSIGVKGVNEKGDTAVLGEASGNPLCKGVHGRAADGGSGVHGEATQNGTGVFGTGNGAGSVGVLASSPNGTALSVDGRASFFQSGVTTIAEGATSKQVGGNGNLTGSSFVLATIQGNVSGVSVRSVAINASTDKFTIYLNRPAPGGAAGGVSDP
ncbi:MAG: hypothetical protein WEB00_09930 [Dehalococcoidia bacterium]